MAHDVFEKSSAAREVFARAAEVLDLDIAKLCFEGPADQLARTDLQQPAIFVASAATWAALNETLPSEYAFSHSGGLSLGEYTALYAAGSLGLEDAVRLVHRRGALMQAAAEAAASGMVSLVGIEEEEANRLCTEAGGDEVLVAANFNCPGQVVVSGSKAACERVVAIADRFGCRAIPLTVAGAFHSPFMESAAQGLRPVLAETRFEEPSLPVIANVDASYHGSAENIRDSLARQVTSPVRWADCIRRLIADGVSEFVEVGPGRALTGMMRRIDRGVETTSINSAEAIEKLDSRVADPAA